MRKWQPREGRGFSSHCRLQDHGIIPCGQIQENSLHTRPPRHRNYVLIIPRETSTLPRGGHCLSVDNATAQRCLLVETKAG